MRKLSNLFGVTILLVMILLSGCKKDKEDTTVDQLVMVKRATGKMYTVNMTTGAMTEVMTLTYNDAPLTGLRGLVYDPATGKCFAGATNQGNGNFYSINLATGAATLLNDNANGDWDAIADLVIAPDGNILSLIYSNIEYNSALAVFNKVSGDDGTHKILIDGTSQDELWSPGALIYGSSEAQLIVGGESEIYFSNLEGVVSSYTSLVPTANIDDSETFVMDMEKVGSTVYAMLYEYNDGNQYFVKLNTSTGVITEIKLIASGENSELYHCMALIPGDKL